MLYQPPRFSPAAIVRGLVVRMVRLVADVRQTAADTAHVDGLNEHALRDLGLRRIESRGDRFYR